MGGKQKLMSILDTFLKKKGVDSPNELTQEEKAVYDDWRLILNKEELTTSDIKDFCQAQIGVIEAKWSDLDVPQAKKSELIPYHTVYRLLLTAIDSPKIARESLERQLTQLIND